MRKRRPNSTDTPGKKILSEIRPAEPARSKDPEPRDIRDYLPQVFGWEVRYSNAQGKTAFVDSRPKISVLDQTDAIVPAALQLAQQKCRKDLVVTGPEEFQTTVVRLVVRNNIGLANPELQERIREEKNLFAAEREQHGRRIRHPLPDRWNPVRRTQGNEERIWGPDPERRRRVRRARTVRTEPPRVPEGRTEGDNRSHR